MSTWVLAPESTGTILGFDLLFYNLTDVCDGSSMSTRDRPFYVPVCNHVKYIRLRFMYSIQFRSTWKRKKIFSCINKLIHFHVSFRSIFTLNYFFTYHRQSMWHVANQIILLFKLYIRVIWYVNECNILHGHDFLIKSDL